MAETPLSAQPQDAKGDVLGGVVGNVRSFPHQMLREIYQQPGTIRETIRMNVEGDVLFPEMLHPIEHARLAFKKIIIAASGSSRHAGLVGEIMMEDLAGVAVDVEYSSEYCYRSTHAGADPI